MKRAWKWIGAAGFAAALMAGGGVAKTWATPQDAAAKPAYTLAEYNAYQAARRLGLASARLLKLSTRGADIVREEVVQLEELAMLSRFARLIDEG